MYGGEFVIDMLVGVVMVWLCVFGEYNVCNVLVVMVVVFGVGVVLLVIW